MIVTFGLVGLYLLAACLFWACCALVGYRVNRMILESRGCRLSYNWDHVSEPASPDDGYAPPPGIGV